MPCCVFYCNLTSQLDPKPFKPVITLSYFTAVSCLILLTRTTFSTVTFLPIERDNRPLLYSKLYEMT